MWAPLAWVIYAKFPLAADRIQAADGWEVLAKLKKKNTVQSRFLARTAASRETENFQTAKLFAAAP